MIAKVLPVDSCLNEKPIVHSIDGLESSCMARLLQVASQKSSTRPSYGTFDAGNHALTDECVADVPLLPIGQNYAGGFSQNDSKRMITSPVVCSSWKFDLLPDGMSVY
jgi:hypothetical protein